MFFFLSVYKSFKNEKERNAYGSVGGMNMDNLHFEQTPYHHICLKDRKSVELTGVKKIESFDSYEFLIETSLGYLNIKGSDLALVRFDQEKKEVSIKGNIDAISYLSNKRTTKSKDSVLNKLLK